MLHNVDDINYNFMGGISIDISKLIMDEPLISTLELADPEAILPTPTCEREMVLRVYQARGLQVMDSGCFGKGSSDPFIRLVHGAGVAETSVKKNALEPTWNEVLLLGCDTNGGEEIKVNVLDWDLMGDNDDMGSGKLAIPIGCEPSPRQWVQLFTENGESAGEVEISLDWRKSRFGSLSLEVAWVSQVESTVAGRLLVHVVQARNLMVCDTSIFSSEGSSDPVVKLMHARQSRETRCIWSTLNPVWQEHFKFTYNTAFPLILTIEDFDLAGNDFMGQAVIKLTEELVKGKKQRSWYKLRGADASDDAEYGEIEVELLWKDNYQYQALEQNALQSMICTMSQSHSPSIVAPNQTIS
jgi:Ca2+-dependent lipid-binding protein